MAAAFEANILGVGEDTKSALSDKKASLGEGVISSKFCNNKSSLKLLVRDLPSDRRPLRGRPKLAYREPVLRDRVKAGYLQELSDLSGLSLSKLLSGTVLMILML